MIEKFRRPKTQLWQEFKGGQDKDGDTFPSFKGKTRIIPSDREYYTIAKAPNLDITKFDENPEQIKIEKTTIHLNEFGYPEQRYLHSDHPDNPELEKHKKWFLDEFEEKFSSKIQDKDIVIYVDQSFRYQIRFIRYLKWSIMKSLKWWFSRLFSISFPLSQVKSQCKMIAKAKLRIGTLPEMK